MLGVIGLIAGVGLSIRWLVFSQPPPVALPAVLAVADPVRVLSQELEVLNERGDLVGVAPGPAGDLEVYVWPLAGSQGLLLAGGPGDERGPDPSPDGTRVVFGSDRDGGGLFVVEVDSREVSPLTSFGEDADWSPDGSAIVFATSRLEEIPGGDEIDPAPALWMVDADGGAPVKVFDGGYEPAWSPGGDRIAFTRRVPRDDGMRLEIATIGPDGSTPEAPEELGGDGRHPRWSSDGRHLLFWSDRDGEPAVWYALADELSGRVLGDPRKVDR